MRIPSPNFARKPYQKQAVQEIASFVVAAFGVLIQLRQTLASNGKPSDAARLAAALYGPDREARLERLAATPASTDLWSLIGLVLTTLGFLALSYFKFLKARDADAKEDQANNPEGLRGCAYVLYAQLKLALGVADDDGTLRVTVFRITEGDEPELEQAIDYVGAKSPSGRGRRFALRRGVIGLAARTGQVQLAERAAVDDAAYKEELIRLWGYRREETEKVTMDRKTTLAIPIPDDAGKTLGVVLVDTRLAHAFDDDLAREIVASVAGFAAYIRERFP